MDQDSFVAPETRGQRLERYRLYQQRYEAFKMADFPNLTNLTNLTSVAEGRPQPLFSREDKAKTVDLSILSDIRKELLKKIKSKRVMRPETLRRLVEEELIPKANKRRSDEEEQKVRQRIKDMLCSRKMCDSVVYHHRSIKRASLQMPI